MSRDNTNREIPARKGIILSFDFKKARKAAAGTQDLDFTSEETESLMALFEKGRDAEIFQHCALFDKDGNSREINFYGELLSGDYNEPILSAIKTTSENGEPAYVFKPNFGKSKGYHDMEGLLIEINLHVDAMIADKTERRLQAERTAHLVKPCVRLRIIQ